MEDNDEDDGKEKGKGRAKGGKDVRKEQEMKEEASTSRAWKGGQRMQPFDWLCEHGVGRQKIAARGQTASCSGRRRRRSRLCRCWNEVGECDEGE